MTKMTAGSLGLCGDPIPDDAASWRPGDPVYPGGGPVSGPQRFRKKPVEITAVQWTGHNTADVAALLGIDDYDPERECRWGDRAVADDAVLHVIRDEPRALAMRTVHGEIAVARVDDWVIPEPKPGHGYPCKPDIFAATYDPIGAEDGA